MIYEEAVTVPFFLGTKTGNLSLATLTNIMLLTSEHQLDRLDAGIAALAKHGAGWVITQYHIAITRMPKVEEPLVVGTEASGYNKLMTYREYWVKDPAGNTLATMSGAWVMMDLTTRKLIPIIESFAAKVEAPKTTKVRRYPRLPKLTDFAHRQPYTVRYFDIDGNGHVNNTHYMEWMEDALGADFLTHHRLTGVDIKFAREVTYGSTVESAYTIDGTASHHQISVAGADNATATMTWETI
ncbi:acyl-[acyl-carrier-protein] thioesterase [Lacticaseibacillus parakribbianus]|uniref:acyl-[acyl-carrier-protein] thioesterase n=1 Tax=Lacticaseibacillus parakribbianus TaxID=2970927 RepID=UPI0021CAF9E0|nr:acyl-ACP thioesterase domain-containing protein [Lacticaseibacillus parakribbianus]